MRWYVNRSGRAEGPTDEPAVVEATSAPPPAAKKRRLPRLLGGGCGLLLLVGLRRGGVTQLLEHLAPDTCELQWVTARDLEGLPTELGGDIMQGVAIPPMNEACGVVQQVDGWERAIAGVSVVVQGKDRTALLLTSMRQTPGTSVCMSPVMARVVEEPAGALDFSGSWAWPPATTVSSGWECRGTDVGDGRGQGIARFTGVTDDGPFAVEVYVTGAAWYGR